MLSKMNLMAFGIRDHPIDTDTPEKEMNGHFNLDLALSETDLRRSRTTHTQNYTHFFQRFFFRSVSIH